ncbi:MAG: hypothetical protein COA40_04960 [Aequorivita sp.]|nr:MAG: hypothetical protein COA40_04960 [Aequorivita sp.]
MVFTTIFLKAQTTKDTVTGISNNYILDVNATAINLDVSTYTSGLYSVALVCDGEIVDSKNLAKQ